MVRKRLVNWRKVLGAYKTGLGIAKKLWVSYIRLSRTHPFYNSLLVYHDTILYSFIFNDSNASNPRCGPWTKPSDMLILYRPIIYYSCYIFWAGKFHSGMFIILFRLALLFRLSMTSLDAARSCVSNRSDRYHRNIRCVHSDPWFIWVFMHYHAWWFFVFNTFVLPILLPDLSEKITKIGRIFGKLLWILYSLLFFIKHEHIFSILFRSLRGKFV